jgi:hypothetical protein
VEQSLIPYHRLLDLTVSAALGSSEAATALDGLHPSSWRDQLADGSVAWIDDQARSDGYLHWALAFPEAYVDLSQGSRRELPGFDLVFGAPPWVVSQEVGAMDAAAHSEVALRARYYEKRWRRQGEPYNPHHAFLSLAHALVCRPGGRTAYVLSSEWLASPTGGI